LTRLAIARATEPCGMRVLIVKLSSLGDVVHTLPVVADIRAARPDALVDWIVEPAFAPLVARVDGVAEVIECALRRWTREGWWRAATRDEFARFLRRLRRERYDAVIDLQGLTKSALIATLARGPTFGLANRTEGASHEWPARWLARHAIRVEPHSHALDRARELVASVLGTTSDAVPSFGLAVPPAPPRAAARTVVLIHGTSRADKLWPEASWIELGRRLVAAGWAIALPQSSLEERERAERIAAAVGIASEVWPALAIGELVDRLAGSAGAIGVDSGPSHIAVALGLAHVQIYNFPTAWRTGPQAQHGARHQLSIEGRPTPDVAAVWTAWRTVQPMAAEPAR
jgi:heptosyltransferase I